MRRQIHFTGIIAGIILLLAGTPLFAQEQALDHVTSSLKAGSSRELATYFNKNVELVLNGEKSSYSKIQAELVLKEFFTSHPPSDFIMVHKGASRQGLHYAIGRYTTQKQSFRVYILLKQFDGRYLIDKMDFDQQ